MTHDSYSSEHYYMCSHYHDIRYNDIHITHDSHYSEHYYIYLDIITTTDIMTSTSHMTAITVNIVICVAIIMTTYTTTDNIIESV